MALNYLILNQKKNEKYFKSNNSFHITDVTTKAINRHLCKSLVNFPKVYKTGISL